MEGIPPIDLHLIFEKSSLKKQVECTLFLVYFELYRPTSEAVKIMFELNKKISSSNSILLAQFFKNQEQIHSEIIACLAQHPGSKF